MAICSTEHFNIHAVAPEIPTVSLEHNHSVHADFNLLQTLGLFAAKEYFSKALTRCSRCSRFSQYRSSAEAGLNQRTAKMSKDMAIK